MPGAGMLVMVVDDHAIFRLGIACGLGNASGRKR
jgi:hypothetical protein